MAVTGETTGRQCWEVHKDAVTGIIEKHIKDPALVKRLADAWDSAVDLGVTTAKASPAQKKKKTDRAIRLTSVRQATSVLLSQIGLIACKWCVYRGLHDCCLTTKKQSGQLGERREGARESGRGRERERASVPVPLSSCEREEGACAGSRGPRSNVVGGGRARPQHTSTSCTCLVCESGA